MKSSFIVLWRLATAGSAGVVNAYAAPVDLKLIVWARFSMNGLDLDLVMKDTIK